MTKKSNIALSSFVDFVGCMSLLLAQSEHPLALLPDGPVSEPNAESKLIERSELKPENSGDLYQRKHSFDGAMSAIGVEGDIALPDLDVRY
jgi:hypothetical protein